MKLDRNCTNIFTLHYLISLISSITYRHWHKMLLSIVYHYIFFLIINYYYYFHGDNFYIYLHILTKHI